VLHKGSKLAIGGGSKSFKTWALLDLALSVAYGKSWLTFATTPGPVLFVNLELPEWALQRRIDSICRAKGTIQEPGKLFVLNLRGKSASYQELIPKIRQRIGKDFSLVIVDPAYKLYGPQAKENEAGDMAGLLNAFEDLAVRSGAAVAFGHHFSKGNQSAKESIDRMSGSGVFARDPDSILVFTKHERDECFTVEATLRNFAPVEPFVVRWDYPLFVQDTTLDPSRLKKPAGRRPENAVEDILALLPESGLTHSEWKEAADENGISKSTFARLLRQLQYQNPERALKEVSSGKWKPIMAPIKHQ
jgi:hypothetical protein